MCVFVVVSLSPLAIVCTQSSLPVKLSTKMALNFSIFLLVLRCVCFGATVQYQICEPLR